MSFQNLRPALFASFLFAALVTASLASNLTAGGDTSKVKNFLPAAQEAVQAELADLTKLYMQLHANPELSLQEVKTSARLAKELKDLGIPITTGVGGHGVIGVLKNGPGPTVLLRTDMDALPVVEATGVPYASKVRARDKEGNDVGVMHACGHDMHMISWVGAARVLARLKDRWQGTVVFMAQPAEEMGSGARDMLKDGLFTRFPRPDYCVALHCDPRYPHGHVQYSESMLLANVDNVDITIKGISGHGSAPHMTVDPIVLSAKIILDLQTIVSRETDPLDSAVVTVGSIHGGTKRNIIPPEVKMELTIRTLKDSVRKNVLEGIQRIVKASAQGAKAPEPIVKIDLDHYTPAVLNDPALTRKTKSLFQEILGEDKVHQIAPIMGGEDFGRLGREGIPICMYFLGTGSPGKIAEAQKPGGPSLPGLHSNAYAPVPEPSIRTGALTLSCAALNLLGK